MAGQAFTGQTQQVAFLNGATLLDHNGGGHSLSQDCIGPCKSNRLVDGGVEQQCFLDFVRGYLLASAVNHLLEPASQAERTIGVLEPFVGGRTLEIWCAASVIPYALTTGTPKTD